MLKIIKNFIELLLRPFIDVLISVFPTPILSFSCPRYVWGYLWMYLTWPIYLIYIHFFDPKTEASRQFIVKRVNVFIIDPVAKTVAPLWQAWVLILIILLILMLVFFIIFWRYDWVIHNRSEMEMQEKFTSWPNYPILGLISLCMILALGFIGFLLARIFYFLYPMYIFYILFIPLGITLFILCSWFAWIPYNKICRGWFVKYREQRKARR